MYAFLIRSWSGILKLLRLTLSLGHPCLRGGFVPLRPGLSRFEAWEHVGFEVVVGSLDACIHLGDVGIQLVVGRHEHDGRAGELRWMHARLRRYGERLREEIGPFAWWCRR